MAFSVADYRKRDAELRKQRSGFEAHWKEINEYVLPRARFSGSDTNQGAKKYNCIINPVALLAIRTATAGMVAGLTSPDRPWFRLGLPDPGRGTSNQAREYLHTSEERMRLVFSKSNIYQCLTANYMDLLAPGTTLTLIDEDEETVLRGYHAPIGSYSLSCSERGKPDTVFRDVTYSVRQLERKFGLPNCSKRVQDLFKDGKFDQPIDVVHVIEPNSDYKPGNLRPTSKKYRSCWFENPSRASGQVDSGSQISGGADANQTFLRESGFSEQRALAARWMVLGEDAYGTNSPGMEGLGNAKAISAYEKEAARQVEMLSGPPLAVPHGMSGVQLLPRKITNLPANAQGNTKAYPLIELTHLPSGIAATDLKIEKLAKQMDRIFYAELWQMLTLGTEGTTPGREMTAEEIRARVEEKLVQLAPMLLRLNDELLSPLIEAAFAIMLRAGLIPEAPPELQGLEIKVEFVSMLHQAMQVIALGGIERGVGFVKSLAEIRPDAIEKMNVDLMIDEYFHTLGLTPNLLLSEEQLAEIRAERAAKEKAASADAAMANAADTAQKLGAVPMNEDTALTRLAGLTGPVEPTGVTGTPAGAQA